MVARLGEDCLTDPVSSEIDVRGTPVRVTRRGCGEPLVVLRGTDASDGWIPFLDLAAQRHDVIVPEHPGFGGRAMPPWLDRVAALRATTVYEPRMLRHMVSGVRVAAIDGDTIRGGANFVVFESLSDREPHILMVGRYLDTLVRGPDSLRFSERLCIYDNYRIRTSLIIPV